MNAESTEPKPETVNEVPAPPRKSFKSKVLTFLSDEFFVIGLIIAIILAYFFPQVAKRDGIIRSQVSIVYGAPAFIFLCSGLAIKSQLLYQNIRNYKMHVVALVMSFLLCSCLFFVFSYAALQAQNPQITLPILVGIILTGCTPTTIASNVMFTERAGGNHVLALVEVTLGNLIGAFVTPAIFDMYLTSSSMFAPLRPTRSGGFGELYAVVFKLLGLSMFLPLAVGQIIRFLLPRPTAWVVQHFYLSKLSSICLILIIWTAFSTAFANQAFSITPPASLIMVAFLGLGLALLLTACSILAGHFLRFSKRDTIALCFIVIGKTPAIGIPLINVVYGSSGLYDDTTIAELGIPMLFYQIEQVLISQISIHFLKRWAKSEIEIE